MKKKLIALGMILVVAASQLAFAADDDWPTPIFSVMSFEQSQDITE